MNNTQLKEQAIAIYNARKSGTAQKNAVSKSNLTKEQAIAAYDSKKRERQRNRIISEVISREKTYESAIPDEYKGILGAADYLETSKKGASIENPSYNDAAGFTLGQWRFGNKPINNIVTFSRDNADDIAQYEGVNEGAVEGVGKYNYRFLTDEEVGVYNYLLGSGDNERAAKYLEDMNDVLEQRHGAKFADQADNVVGKTFLSGLGGLKSGLQGLTDLPAMIAGTEGSKRNAIDYAASKIRSEASGIEGVLYDATSAGAGMLPAILVSAVTAGAGAPTLVASVAGNALTGLNAAGNGYTEMRRLGYNDSQARTYGIITGTLEALLQAGLGGISKLGGNILGKSAIKAIAAMDNAVGRLAVKLGSSTLAKYLGSIGSEALEEGLQEFLDPIVRGAVTGEDIEWASFEDVVYSALLGAILGGGFEGADIALKSRAKAKAESALGRRTAELEGNTDNVLAAAQLTEDAEIANLIEKFDKAKRQSKRDRLLGQITAKTVEKSEKWNNDLLTKEEAKRFGVTPEEYDSDKTDFDRQMDQYYENYKLAADNELAKLATLSKIASADDFESLEEEIAANDKFAEDYADHYEGNLKTAYADGFKEFNAERDDNTSALTYPLYFEMARKLGLEANGRSFKEMLSTLSKEDQNKLLTLPTSALSAAFDDGIRVSNEEKELGETRKRAEEIRKKKTEELEKKATTENTEKTATESPLTEDETSNVIVGEEVKGRKLSEAQEKAVKRIKALGKYLSGFNFYIGTAKDIGIRTAGATVGNEFNGYYSRKSNTIYLNIDAGTVSVNLNGRAINLYSYAIETAWTHEIGHTIKENSPAMWEDLKNFVKTNYYTERSYDMVVRERLAQYSEVVEGFTYADAEEEVICNSLGRMMESERVLSKLAADEPNIFKRIFRLIKRFFQSIAPKRVDYRNATIEERIVGDLLERKDKQLEDKFIAALKSANMNADALNVVRREETSTKTKKEPPAAENSTADRQLEGQQAENATEGKIEASTAVEGGEVEQKIVAKEPDNAKSVSKESGSFSLSENNEIYAANYRKRIDAWDGITEGFSFTLGATPEYLSNIKIEGKKIGYRQVKMDASKVKKILRDHPEMSLPIIKKLPDILNNPIIVLDSKTVKGSLVLFGEVYVKNKPVMMSLEINPTTRSGKSTYLDVIKVSSAYTRNNTQNILNTSNIRYIDENKNRVNDWLKVNRLQLPLPNYQSNSANTIIPETNPKINPSDEKNIKKFSLSDESYLAAVESGDIVSLSKRFDNSEKDIRYSLVDAPTVNLDEDSDLSKAVKNIYGSEKYKIITNYIYELLGDKLVTLSDGRVAIVDRRDASHIASGAADKKTAQISKIKELIKKAQPYAFDDKVEHNKFDYFVYYAVNVKYENEVFPIYLNVGRTTNDKRWHLYDIKEKIRDTADRINGLEQLGENPSGALKNGISGNIIIDVQEKINPFDEKNTENSEKISESEGLKFSLTDRLNREALAGAFLELAENDVERDIVNKYIDAIDELEAAVEDRRRWIEERDRFKKIEGMEGETARLSQLIRQSNNYINKNNESLLKLTAAKPLRDVVNRYKKRNDPERGISADVVNDVDPWQISEKRGRYNQALAEYTKSKVYTKTDSRRYIEQIEALKKIKRETREKLYNSIWQGLNALNTQAQREDFIKYKSKEIVRAIVDEATVLNPEFIDAKKVQGDIFDYLQRLEFTDEQRAHIKERYGDKHARGVFKRWVNNSVDSPPISLEKFVADFVEKNPKYQNLEAKTTIEAFEEINDLYNELMHTAQYIPEYKDTNGSELYDLEKQIEQGLIDTFEKGGRETEKARYKEFMDEQYARVELDRTSRMIRDKKLGTFENATQVKGDTITGILRDLSRFEWRKTFSPNNAREKVAKLLEWYTTDNPMLGYVDSKNPGMYSSYIHDTMKAIAEGTGKLSAEELRGINNVLKHVLHVAESYTKVWYRDKWIDLPEESKHFIDKLLETKNHASQAKTNGMVKALAAGMKVYADEFLDPRTVAVLHDRGVEGGFFTRMLEELEEGEINYQIALNNAMEDYYEFFEKNPEYARKAQLETVKVYGKNIPKASAITLYLTIKQYDAQRGFIESGFDFYDATGELIHARSINQEAAIAFKRDLVYKKMLESKKSEADAKRLADEAIKDGYTSSLMTAEEMDQFVAPFRDKISESFSDKDRQLIRIVENGFNNVLREKKRLTDIARMGFSNVREGPYTPIKRVIAGRVEELGYLDELQSVSNISANKDRRKGASQTLMIRNIFKVYENHAKAICLYENVQPFIDYYDRLYNFNASDAYGIPGTDNDPFNVKRLSTDIWGKHEEANKLVGSSFERFLKDLVEDVQGLKAARQSPINKLISEARGATARASLSLNAKVLMSQLSSLTAAFSTLKASSITKSELFSVKNFKNLFTKEGRAELEKIGMTVDKYCALAKVRNADNTVYLSQGVVEKNGALTPKNAVMDNLRRFSDKLMQPISIVDRAVVCTLFEACKHEVATASAPFGSEANLKAAGEKLTEVITKTQQTSLATTKSAAMRSPNELMKTFTMFTADSMRTVSRVYEASVKYAYLRGIMRKNDGKLSPKLEAKFKSAKRELAKSATTVVAISAFMAAVTLAFRALRGKIKDDENILATLGSDFFSGFFAGTPLISDAIERLFGMNTYDITDSGISTITDFISSISKVANTVKKVISGERDIGALVGALKSLAVNSGQILGIPIRNAWNFIYGLIKMFDKDAAKSIDKFLK